MSQNLNSAVAVIGIDIGKNSFHVVRLNDRGAIVLRQKWSRGQIEVRLANVRPCLIGMEACVGAHHLSRKLQALGHDARLMPAKYVRPYSKGQKNASCLACYGDDYNRCPLSTFNQISSVCSGGFIGDPDKSTIGRCLLFMPDC